MPADGSPSLPRRVAKADLPTKICPVCARPFSWRRRWARVWHEVRYCSAACRGRRHLAAT